MSLKDDIQRFAHDLEQADNAASDLWSWLPSHKAAEKAHGDYADEYQPDHADIMWEAAVYFSILNGHERVPAAIEQWFGCPCQECEEAKGKLPAPLMKWGRDSVKNEGVTIGQCDSCGAEGVEVCPFGGCRTCHAQSSPPLDWDKCQADWAKAMSLKRQQAALHEKKP